MYTLSLTFCTARGHLDCTGAWTGVNQFREVQAIHYFGYAEPKPKLNHKKKWLPTLFKTVGFLVASLHIQYVRPENFIHVESEHQGPDFVSTKLCWS